MSSIYFKIVKFVSDKREQLAKPILQRQINEYHRNFNKEPLEIEVSEMKKSIVASLFIRLVFLPIAIFLFMWLTIIR